MKSKQICVQVWEQASLQGHQVCTLSLAGASLCWERDTEEAQCFQSARTTPFYISIRMHLIQPSLTGYIHFPSQVTQHVAIVANRQAVDNSLFPGKCREIMKTEENSMGKQVWEEKNKRVEWSARQ